MIFSGQKTEDDADERRVLFWRAHSEEKNTAQILFASERTPFVLYYYKPVDKYPLTMSHEKRRWRTCYEKNVSHSITSYRTHWTQYHITEWNNSGISTAFCTRETTVNNFFVREDEDEVENNL